MRAPRYRFPNEVRSATRAMASTMVREGTVVDTPEGLDLWVTEHPDVRDPLVKGGYGRQFDANDLLPLLQVFVVKAGGPAPETEAPPPTPARKRPIVVVVALLLAAIVVAWLVAS